MKVLKIVNRKGQEHDVLLDDDDYERVSCFKWCVDSHGYVVRRKHKSEGDQKMQKLHRFLLEYNGHLCVDHKDGNPLNNCKSNLRLCTNAENSRNRKRNNDNSSFKGVYLCRNKYRAMININRKLTHLGLFKTAIEAASKYNEAAITHYGSFARLNLIPE